MSNNERMKKAMKWEVVIYKEDAFLAAELYSFLANVDYIHES